MCDYCETLEAATDAFGFEDMCDCYPVEFCETMCYTASHEVYLVRHGADWYLALVNTRGGTVDTISVNACPVCGRRL